MTPAKLKAAISLLLKHSDPDQEIKIFVGNDETIFFEDIDCPDFSFPDIIRLKHLGVYMENEYWEDWEQEAYDNAEDPENYSEDLENISLFLANFYLETNNHDLP